MCLYSVNGISENWDKRLFRFKLHSKLLCQHTSFMILTWKSETVHATCSCVAIFRDTQQLVGVWRCSVQPPQSEDTSRYRFSREILITWAQQKSLFGEGNFDIIKRNICIKLNICLLYLRKRGEVIWTLSHIVNLNFFVVSKVKTLQYCTYFNSFFFIKSTVFLNILFCYMCNSWKPLQNCQNLPMLVYRASLKNRREKLSI